jgi:hypothetical protein
MLENVLPDEPRWRDIVRVEKVEFRRDGELGRRRLPASPDPGYYARRTRCQIGVISSTRSSAGFPS